MTEGGNCSVREPIPAKFPLLQILQVYCIIINIITKIIERTGRESDQNIIVLKLYKEFPVVLCNDNWYSSMQ